MSARSCRSSAPLLVKGIGWILLLGPNNGLINVWLRGLFGIEGVPIELFGLGGMIFVEGLLWTPIALLLALPPLTAMDPALEEAATMCGASRWQVLKRVTIAAGAAGHLRGAAAVLHPRAGGL